MMFNKIKDALKTRKSQDGKPSPERMEEVLSFCARKELDQIVRVFETNSMMDILNFIRVSGALEVMDSDKKKSYGEFHEDLVILIKNLGIYLKLKKYEQKEKRSSK